MERKEFERLIRQYGAEPVRCALLIREEVRSGKTEDSIFHPAYREQEPPELVTLIYRILFDPDLSQERLWERYLGVSESATIPLQTPRARVTPKEGCEIGKF